MCTIDKNGESKFERKLLTPASRNNGIKVDIVINFLLQTYGFFIYK